MAMTNRGVVLKLLMDELGIDSDLKSFRSRLILQKSVYLLKALGMPTTFTYRWYLRGSYSPSLTKAAFDESIAPRKAGDETHKGYSLSDAAGRRLSVLKQMVDERETVGLSEGNWLELLASMHFYRYEMYFPKDEQDKRKNAAWLYDQLPLAKKNLFTRSQAKKAADVLKGHRLW